MKNMDLLRAMEEVDSRFVEEAAPVFKKKTTWYRWAGAAAACIILVAGLLVWPLLRGNSGPETGGRYKYTIAQQEAAAPVLRWEDRTLGERYLEMSLNGVTYSTRGQAIDPSLLGEMLGVCHAIGFDHYTDQTYHQDFTVYAIQGIRDAKLVAVAMERTYYVFRVEGYDPPATLGKLMTVYNLTESLALDRFSCENAYYRLENHAYVWEILTHYADAPLVEDVNFSGGEHYISFTATSQALGVYKRVLYITADGYLKTNIWDYAYVYQIGEEAAAKIMEYAMDHAAETEAEPYANFVAGTITEIGDGYILVNDAVLCWDAADAVEYKVLTTDPVFSRWFRYYDLQAGDVVYIRYRGDMAEGNVIDGAYTINEAILRDGYLLMYE